MLHGLLTFAAETTEHGSKAVFNIIGAVLAAWAVAIAFLGMARHRTWPGEGSGRAIMGVSALLVVATMAAAALTG